VLGKVYTLKISPDPAGVFSHNSFTDSILQHSAAWFFTWKPLQTTPKLSDSITLWIGSGLSELTLLFAEIVDFQSPNTFSINMLKIFESDKILANLARANIGLSIASKFLIPKKG
jgi:hypothetical protein